MIKSSKFVADIGDYTVERDQDGVWILNDSDRCFIELGTDDQVAEMADDLKKLVAAWGGK